MAKTKIAGIILLVTAFIVYSGYLYCFLPVKDPVVSASQQEGKMLWQRFNCNACHQVYGLGGYLGPDLTNIYSLKGPAYIHAFLQNGTITMPNFKLNKHQIKAITDYLQNIDRSGISDPRKFIVHNNGSISK